MLGETEVTGRNKMITHDNGKKVVYKIIFTKP